VVEPDLATIGKHRPADQIEGGGLSRAVRADQRRDRALLDGERQTVDRVHAAEPLLQSPDLEQRRAGSRGRRPAAVAGKCWNAVQPPPDRRRGALGAAPLPELFDGGDDAPWQQQDRECQQAAEDQQARVAAAQLLIRQLVDSLDQKGAKDRPPDGPPASENHGEHDLNAEHDVEHPDRVEEGQVVAVDPARHPEEDGRGGEAQ
jgi:hypothetical protein